MLNSSLKKKKKKKKKTWKDLCLVHWINLWDLLEKYLFLNLSIIYGKYLKLDKRKWFDLPMIQSG